MNFTKRNADNITEAIHGLDIFTKNWCMNCAETDRQKDLIFRCKECEFGQESGECLIKVFDDYPLEDFGSMGMH